VPKGEAPFRQAQGKLWGTRGFGKLAEAL